jgi:outer membrane protein, heavy metal efflux system
MPTGSHGSGWAFAATVALGLAGCSTTPVRSKPAPTVAAETPEILPTTHLVLASSHETPAEPSTPLSLNDLLALSRRQNPDLAIAAARVTEAEGQFVQAGLYPNPTVGYIGNQINDGPGTAGQQGVFVSQEVVSGGKLEVARQAAGHGLTAADWQAVSRRNETAARVRGAYYEYMTARAILRESEGIVGQFEAGLRKAESLAAAGTVFNYEVRRFRIELTQAKNRVGTARERLVAAERLLSTAVGLTQLPTSVAAADLPIPAPAVDFDQAVAASERGSYLREAAALTDQAREQVRLADLQNLPNLQVHTAGMYDFAIQAPIANVQVGVTLPVWHRNEGNILAAQGRLAQAQAGVGQARVRVRERLATAYQKYRNARRQMDLYEKEILPDAQAALEQVEKVYEAKGERFFETLDARRVLAQARIDHLQALGDCWQALSEIEGLTQPADKR